MNAGVGNYLNATPLTVGNSVNADTQVHWDTRQLFDHAAESWLLAPYSALLG